MVSQDSDALVDHLVSELGISKEDVLVAHSTDSAHLKEGHCPGVLTNNCYLFVHLTLFMWSWMEYVLMNNQGLEEVLERLPKKF